jgi:hypothetical protein
MSLLEKIAHENFDRKDDNLIRSITEQINMIFHNRVDQYYSYNFSKNKLVAIHEVFKLDYFSPEFLARFAQVVEAFEPRLENVNILVAKKNNQAQLIIQAQLANNGERIPNIYLKI